MGKIPNKRSALVVVILILSFGLIALCSVHAADARTTSRAGPIANEAPSFQMALRYEHGEGVGQDYALALQYFCDAAIRGDRRAFVELGWMYAYGRGVHRDDGVAVGWWGRAADAGVPQAVNLLRLLSDVKPSTKLGCQSTHFIGPSPDKASPALRAIVQRQARRTDVDAKLVLAVIAVESGFDPHALSKKHAMGLMQLTAQIAERFGVRDPYDVEQNIRGGTSYLSWLLHRFHGNLTLALAAYNAGENAVDRYSGVPPFDETVEYIRRIKRYYPTHGIVLR